MAKWEIRFQRFALSFRPSALGLCRFLLPLEFSLQPLAFASVLVGSLPRETESFTLDVRANEFLPHQSA